MMTVILCQLGRWEAEQPAARIVAHRADAGDGHQHALSQSTHMIALLKRA